MTASHPTSTLSFLYLLHFDEPLHHAEHYLGSSTHLRARLAAHANGHGARLTEVLCERQIEWQVAALFVLRPDAPLTILAAERLAKRQHNSRDYCPICNPDWRPPTWTIPYPVELLALLATSTGARFA